MSEITLSIPEEHLQAFLSHLQGFTYIRVEQIRAPKRKKPFAKSATARALQTLAADDPFASSH